MVRDYSDDTPDVNFFYDGTGLGSVPAFSKGKTTKVTSSVSETRFTSFDNLGRLLQSEQRTPFTDSETVATATPRVSSYQYDNFGKLLAETYPSGRTVNYDYNQDGEVARIGGAVNGQARLYANGFAYDAAGDLQQMHLGNGKWETAQYNTRLQVTQIGLGNNAGDTSLLKLEYGYGDNTQNNGSLRSQKISFSGLSQPFEQSYSYDDLNRLQSATETASGATTWKQTFLYDRFGNRRFDANNTTTLAASNDVTNPAISTATNRLSSPGYVYDKNGNLTNDATGKLFAYDAESHQKEVRDASNNVIGTYLYDGEGKRVKKISATETTVFVYDGGGQLVAEYSTQQAATPQVSYLTEDHLGSPRVITDGTGKVIARKDFAAFGEETFTTERTSGLGYKPEELRQDYTGYQKDDESGLEFAQARYYNTLHGRFTSVDPLTASASIRDPQTFNRYSYGLNSPYKFNDPLGLIYNGAGNSGGGFCSAANDNCAEGGEELTTQSIDEYRKRQEQPPSPATSNAHEQSHQSALHSTSAKKRRVALAARVSKDSHEENAFLYRAKQATSEVAQFDTGGDIIRLLWAFSETGAIDEIIIHDHGFEGGIIGNGDWVGLYTDAKVKSEPHLKVLPVPETTGSFASAVDAGQINIAKNGSIVIYGCNCSNIAEELSIKLGDIGRGDISVTGANNKVWEKNGSAAVDRVTTGISAGSRGSFITYKNGIQISTSLTRSYK